MLTFCRKRITRFHELQLPTSICTSWRRDGVPKRFPGYKLKVQSGPYTPRERNQNCSWTETLPLEADQKACRWRRACFTIMADGEDVGEKTRERFYCTMPGQWSTALGAPLLCHSHYVRAGRVKRGRWGEEALEDEGAPREKIEEGGGQRLAAVGTNSRSTSRAWRRSTKGHVKANVLSERFAVVVNLPFTWTQRINRQVEVSHKDGI